MQIITARIELTGIYFAYFLVEKIRSQPIHVPNSPFCIYEYISVEEKQSQNKFK